MLITAILIQASSYLRNFGLIWAKISESSNTPTLISLEQIQLTGTEATLGGGGAEAWTCRHLQGAISFTPGDEKSQLSGLALKDRKIGDKVRAACGERTHSIPSQGGRSRGWKQVGEERSRRKRRDRAGISDRAHLSRGRTGIKAIQTIKLPPPPL